MKQDFGGRVWLQSVLSAGVWEIFHMVLLVDASADLGLYALLDMCFPFTHPSIPVGADEPSGYGLLVWSDSVNFNFC